MQSCDIRNLLAPGVREMKVVGMKVDDIEIFSPAENFLDHQHVVRQRIHTIRIQPQRPLAAFHQFAFVTESPLANKVTSWPRQTSFSVSHDTTRSVPP